MKTTEKEPLAETLINGLKKAIVEVEEFRVQAALGKAEAKDLYEKLKKDFRQKLHELKHNAEHISEDLKGDALKLKAVFEALEVQLALGKAETKEMFEEQRKAIQKVLSKLENLIRSNPVLNEYNIKMHAELEKFRIKMEILKLRFELKKMDAGEEFETRKTELRKMAEEFRHKLRMKQVDRMDHVKDELSKAYEHLKNAFA
jgi:hypothetical protein